MHNVELLFHTLNDEGLDSVRSLKLKGKQEAVMGELLLSHEEDREANIESLGLSKSHADQISSVLLQKCYKVLVPDGFEPLCNFLIEKGLGKLLYNHLRLIEKSGEALGTQEAKESFYEIAFESSLRVPINELDFAVADRYAGLYLANKKIRSEHDPLFIDLRKLRAEITLIAAGKDNLTTKGGTILERLQAMDEMLLGNDFPALQCQCHIAYTEYYSRIDPQPQFVLSHLKEAMKYMDSLPPHMLRREKGILTAQLANSEYMLGHFEEAYRLATQLYLIRRSMKYLSSSTYYTIRYTEIVAILGKFDEAEQVLAENFAHAFAGKENNLSAMVAITYAVICLMQGRYDEAREHIERGLSINSGKLYSLQSEITLRFLEAAYHFFTKDWVFTTTLIERALQLLRRNEHGLRQDDVGFQFSFIKAVMLSQEEGTPIPPAIMEKYNQYSTGQYRFLGMVLEKIFTFKK